MAKQTGFLPNSLVNDITCLLDRGYHYHLWKVIRCSFKYFEQAYFKTDCFETLTTSVIVCRFACALYMILRLIDVISTALWILTEPF